MNRSLSLHPVSLALGLVCLLSMSQTSVPRDSWGPPKKDIVNLFYGYPQPVLNVPIGGNVSVFDVPPDRWLTVTATLTDACMLVWAEDQGGILTVKGSAMSNCGSGSFPALQGTPQLGGGAIGWTFRPGTKVVIFNTAPYTSVFSTYTLTGYLSRE